MNQLNSNRLFWLGFFNGFFNLIGINHIPAEEAKKVYEASMKEKLQNDLSKINEDFNRTLAKVKQQYEDIVR